MSEDFSADLKQGMEQDEDEVNDDEDHNNDEEEYRRQRLMEVVQKLNQDWILH